MCVCTRIRVGVWGLESLGVRRLDFIPVEPAKYLYPFPVVRGVEFDKYLGWDLDSSVHELIFAGRRRQTGIHFAIVIGGSNF